MQQILIYGDSLSWGIIPGTRRRFDFSKRWPGVMEAILRDQGEAVRVIEDCLNGRRTSWDDPVKPGRNGLVGLEQRIEINSPLAVVIVFLGTNDFQSMHNVDARKSAQGVGEIIEAVRRAPLEPGMPSPKILAVAPPPIQVNGGSMATKFAGAATKSDGHAEAIEKVASDYECYFFDSGSVTESSKIDGVHLDEDQHQRVGVAIATEVQKVLHQA